MKYKGCLRYSHFLHTGPWLYLNLCKALKHAEGLVCVLSIQSELGLIFHPGIIPVALLFPGKLNQAQK